MRKPERILTWEEQALLEQECGLSHDEQSAEWRRDLYRRLDAMFTRRAATQRSIWTPVVFGMLALGWMIVVLGITLAVIAS